NEIRSGLKFPNANRGCSSNLPRPTRDETLRLPKISSRLCRGDCGAPERLGAGHFRSGEGSGAGARGSELSHLFARKVPEETSSRDRRQLGGGAIRARPSNPGPRPVSQCSVFTDALLPRSARAGAIARAGLRERRLPAAKDGGD